jgi:hypothetical protein
MCREFEIGNKREVGQLETPVQIREERYTVLEEVGCEVIWVAVTRSKFYWQDVLNFKTNLREDYSTGDADQSRV